MNLCKSNFGFLVFTFLFISALAGKPVGGGELDASAPIVLKGHTGMIPAVAVDAAGHRILTGGADKTAIAWDLGTGKELQKYTEKQPVTALALSADGRRAVIGFRDKSVLLWDAETGRAIAALPKFKDFCTSAAFNEDGTQYVTGTDGGDIWLWDTSDTKKPVRPFKGHAKSVDAVAFSSNGMMLISGGSDKVLATWDVETGKNRVAISDAHPAGILSVALDTSGMYALSGSADKSATLWDVSEEKRIGRVTAHKDAVVMVAFLSDNSFLTASKDRNVMLWDMKGKQLETFRAEAPIVSGCLSADGSTLALGMLNGAVTALRLKAEAQNPQAGGLGGRLKAGEDKNVDTPPAAGAASASRASGNDRLVFRFQGHGDQVTSVAYGPNNRNFVSSSKEGKAILWDFDGENAKSSSLDIGKGAFGAAVLADNRSVVVAGEDLSIFFWNAASKAPAKMLNAHSAPLMCVAAMKSGSGWASGGRDFNIYLWNGGGSDAVGKLTGHKETVMGIAFNLDGSRLASASADQTVGIWDTRAKKGLQQLKGHTNVARCVAFSADGKLLASGSFDNTAKIWDVGTGKMLKSVTHADKGIFGVAFSGDGKRLFTGGGDRNIVIWDVDTGEKLETLTGQPGAVTCLSVSPDGTRLLSSGGKEILLWDISK